MSLVFIGFMGAGKSSAAREAAKALGVRCIDTDRLVAQELGTSIEAFFDAYGEEAFRVREEAIVLRTLDQAGDATVALGGGSVLSERVRGALSAHTTVLCEVSERTAWRRANGKGRPLARDRDAFAARYAERHDLYEELADAFLPEGPREAGRRAAHHLAALRHAPRGTRLVWARGGASEHPVLLGRGVLGRAPWPLPMGRRYCVTDEHVGAAHLDRVGELAGLIEMPPGEEAKTLATCQAVWSALVAQGATRADHVVALGGGVVGDLAGFCAATYQRGMPVVQCPTTLVAQVDSAYGGKTGVDLPDAKNYVGAYHQPSAVLVDHEVLATLPPEEWAAGYAEVLKTAIIAGGPLWDSLRAGEPVDDEVILRCARTKLAVVAADERDGGRRQLLNLGHTVGHAIETETGFARLRHGEAVGLGLLAALRLSGQDALREEVEALLQAAGLPVVIDGLDPAGVAAATHRDKKRLTESTPFVLVHAPGDVRYGQNVSAGDLLAAVGEVVRP